MNDKICLIIMGHGSIAQSLIKKCETEQIEYVSWDSFDSKDMNCNLAYVLVYAVKEFTSMSFATSLDNCQKLQIPLVNTCDWVSCASEEGVFYVKNIVGTTSVIEYDSSIVVANASMDDFNKINESASVSNISYPEMIINTASQLVNMDFSPKTVHA